MAGPHSATFFVAQIMKKICWLKKSNFELFELTKISDQSLILKPCSLGSQWKFISKYNFKYFKTLHWLNIAMRWSMKSEIF